MGSDEDLRALRLGLDRAGQERDLYSQLRADRLDREEMLLGKRLGGRHQRRLQTALDGA